MTNYNDDFFAWTQETARAIEAGRFEQIDRTALADEVESLGKSDWKELRSRLAVIVLHLLKMKYQPEKRTRSWDSSISEQQIGVDLVIEYSPSLKPRLPEFLQQAYKIARLRAASETGLPIKTFPEKCEWSIEEVLSYTGNG